MKTLITTLIFVYLVTFKLFAQTELSFDFEYAGLLTTGQNLCYSFTAEEDDSILINYNMMTSSIEIKDESNATLFEEYQDQLSESYKEKLLVIESDGSYTICFSTTSAMGMYQLLVSKVKNETTTTEAIPLNYGEVINDFSEESGPVRFTFQGNANDTIRLGFSFMLARLQIESPGGATLWDEFYTAPPDSGLVIDMKLNETGSYVISLTPQLNFLQYALGLYRIYPIEATEIQFGNTISSTLPNWGILYYKIIANKDDIFDISFTGVSSSVTLTMITPSGDRIICNDNNDGYQISHQLTAENSGEYVLMVNSSLAGPINYDLVITNANKPIEAIPYSLGELITAMIPRMEKRAYSFHLDAGDRLQFGLNLTSSAVQIKSPSGQIIYSYDKTSLMEFGLTLIDNIEVNETGTYEFIFWHNLVGSEEQEMKFCASIIQPAETMERDSVYKIPIGPYHVVARKFHAVENEILRISVPYGSWIYLPDGDSIELEKAKIFQVEQTGDYYFEMLNPLEDSIRYEAWVNTITPPVDYDTVNIGETFIEAIESYDTKSIGFTAQKGDTIYFQGTISELIFQPTIQSVRASNTYIYITTPSGKTTRLKGEYRGLAVQYGCLLSYYFKKQIIFDENGIYTFTAVLDKAVILNPTSVSMRIEKSGAKMEIPYNVSSSYELPGIYSCQIPEGLSELFVVVKKNNYIGYDATWRGIATLEQGDNQWKSAGYSDERDDFIFQIPNPESGEYQLPISSNIDDEIRGSILFTDQLPEATLNHWTPGVSTRPYGSDWMTAQIGAGVDTLYFESEGYGLWSTIEVTYDNLDNSDERWIFQNMGEGYHIQGKIANPKAGRYFIRYVDSAVLQESGDGFFNHSEDQTKEYLLYVGTTVGDNAGQLSIHTLSTHTIGQGVATFSIEGTGFDENQLVSLIDSTETDTIQVNVQQVENDKRKMDVGLDFSAVATGNYFLEVAAVDTLVRYAKTIEITPATNTRLEGSLMTSDLYRLGRKQRCILRIKNTGNTNIANTAGRIYTDNEKVRLLLTNDLYLNNDADSINDIMQEELVDEIPFYIQNLAAGDELELVYKIQSTSLIENEEFVIGYQIGELSKNDFYTIQDSLAYTWYNYLTSSDAIPPTMRECVLYYGWEYFRNVWYDTVQDEEKSALTVYDEENEKLIRRMDHDMDRGIKVLDYFAGKTLVFRDDFGDKNEVLGILTNPYNAAKAGVKVIWNKAKEISRALSGLFGFGSDDEDEKKKKSVNSTTPEDKYGPNGYGMERGNGFIDSLPVFEYQIDYWNKEDATAPAAIVYIRDTIDTDFNLKTLRFTEIGFLRWKVKLDGGQYFNVNVDCRPDMPYIVNVEGTVDYKTREVFWVHTTLDPETMDLPDDPLAGYLPGIDSTGYQIGWVRYTMEPNQGLPDGTTFENQAFVNFDGVGKWGPAPKEGPYTNIFDFSLPESAISPEYSIDGDSVLLSWEGTDSGSGIKDYTIYVSSTNQDTIWIKNTSNTSAYFRGEKGKTYKFFSIARDNVNNIEAMKYAYEVSVYFDQTDLVDFRNQEEFHFYPNPTHGKFKIEFPVDNKSTQILAIYNMQLNLMDRIAVSNTDVIDISDYPKGMYLLRLSSDQDIKTRKLMKY